MRTTTHDRRRRRAETIIPPFTPFATPRYIGANPYAMVGERPVPGEALAGLRDPDSYLAPIGTDEMEPDLFIGDLAMCCPNRKPESGDTVILVPRDIAAGGGIARLVMAPIDGWESWDWARSEVSPAMYIEMLNPLQMIRVTDMRPFRAMHVVTAALHGPDHQTVRPLPRRLERIPASIANLSPSVAGAL